MLQYVARGHTYREIGEELFIAEKTVENHVRNILGKLHLNRKQELIRYALEHGIRVAGLGSPRRKWGPTRIGAGTARSMLDR